MPSNLSFLPTRMPEEPLLLKGPRERGATDIIAKGFNLIRGKFQKVYADTA